MNEIKQRSLSKEKIYLAALEVINVDGLEGLKMRRLAQQLNVEAASLYNHVKNKSALLDLIQDSLFKELPSPKEQNNWQKYLREFAQSVRLGLLKYPKTVPLFATRPSVTVSALEQTEKAFSILRTAGFKYSDIIFAYQSLCVFILGHLQAEVGHVPGAKAEIEPSLNIQNTKNFPHLMKAYSESGFKNYDAWFKFGVTAIITGLEKILETTKRKKT
jgi:AcrR family transcriptional regulator